MIGSALTVTTMTSRIVWNSVSENVGHHRQPTGKTIMIPTNPRRRHTEYSDYISMPIQTRLSSSGIRSRPKAVATSE